MMTRALALVVLPLVASCAPSTEPAAVPAVESSNLPEGIVATVGPLSITAAAVGDVAQHARVTSEIALERLVSDALFANGALRNKLDEQPSARAAIRARLARAVLERLHDEASRDEPDESEIAAATARHFVELDRPEAFRVVHALVKLPESADAATTARARALAERLAEEVAPARDEEDFKARAEKLDGRGNLEVIVETLKPVAADGRVVDVEHPTAEPDTFVLPFARAAARLAHPGQKSGVVTTEFGFHVMMLLERVAPKTVAPEERKRLLRDEIVTERAKRLKSELLARLAAEHPFSIERSAEALLRTVGSSDEAH